MCGARSGHVTRVAEEMGIQREALGARLIGELLPTLLEREREREIRGGNVDSREAGVG